MIQTIAKKKTHTLKFISLNVFTTLKKKDVLIDIEYSRSCLKLTVKIYQDLWYCMNSIPLHTLRVNQRHFLNIPYLRRDAFQGCYKSHRSTFTTAKKKKKKSKTNQVFLFLENLGTQKKKYMLVKMFILVSNDHSIFSQIFC